MTKSFSQSLTEQYGHSQCVLCGHKNPLSLGLTFTPHEDGSVRTSLQGRRLLQGYDQILHGGVLASLLDSSMTHCLFHQGIEAVTADLHVRYIHSVPCQALLTISARMLARKGPLCMMRAELFCDDELSVWAEAKFMMRKKP